MYTRRYLRYVLLQFFLQFITDFVIPRILHLNMHAETAMGRHVNAQNQGDSEYVKAVYK